jgi:hypothetical protein
MRTCKRRRRLVFTRTHGIWLFAWLSCSGVSYAFAAIIGGTPRSYWDFLDASGIAILLGMIGALVVGAFAGDKTWRIAIQTIANGSILYGSFLATLWIWMLLRASAI